MLLFSTRRIVLQPCPWNYLISLEQIFWKKALCLFFSSFKLGLLLWLWFHKAALFQHCAGWNPPVWPVAPSVMWANTVSELLMTGTATHNWSLCDTDIAIHAYRPKKRPFEAFYVLPRRFRDKLLHYFVAFILYLQLTHLRHFIHLVSFND